MSDILLGIAAGSFIAAIINHKFNTVKWIKTRYLVLIGVITLILSFILGWPDFKRGFQSGYEEATGSISKTQIPSSNVLTRSLDFSSLEEA